jgi:CheY-like chemotaxis protein
MALILFIDDDLGSRTLYDKACLILGHHSLLAESGKQGLVLAGERQPNLIVLDLSLPDMDGLKVLAQLRKGKLTAHIPVVIVSAGTSEQDPQVSQAAGAAAYLNKPVGLNALQHAIDHFSN